MMLPEFESGSEALGFTEADRAKMRDTSDLWRTEGLTFNQVSKGLGLEKYGVRRATAVSRLIDTVVTQADRIAGSLTGRYMAADAQTMDFPAPRDQRGLAECADVQDLLPPDDINKIIDRF